MYESVDPVLKHGWYRYEWRFYEPGASEPIPVTGAERHTLDATSGAEIELVGADFYSAGASTARVVSR